MNLVHSTPSDLNLKESYARRLEAVNLYRNSVATSSASIQLQVQPPLLMGTSFQRELDPQAIAAALRRHFGAATCTKRTASVAGVDGSLS